MYDRRVSTSLSFPRHGRAPVVLGALLLCAGAIAYRTEGPRPFAVALAFGGVVALASRVTCTVGADRERVWLWATLVGVPFIPFWTARLDGARAVSLECVGRGRSRYRVSIRVADRMVVLWCTGAFLRARRFAAAAASGLELPLQDASTGRLRIRAPEAVDETLGARLSRRGRAVTAPCLPVASGIRVRQGSDTVIVVPGQRLHPVLALVWLGAPASFGVFCWAAMPLASAVQFVAAAAFFEACFAWAYAVAVGSRRFVLGRDAVEVRTFGSRRRLPFAELEDVVQVGVRVHLVARRAHVVVPLGTPRNARFVLAAILRAAFDDAATRDATGPGVASIPAPRAVVRFPTIAGSRDGSRAGRIEAAPPPRRRAPRDDSVTQLCVGVALIGIALAGGGAWWAASTGALVRRATVTTGTVIGFSRTFRENVHHPVVRYKLPSGEVRVFRSGSGGTSRGYVVGDLVEVIHDPENRAADRIRSFGDLWGGPLVLLGIGTAFAAGGLAFLAGERRSP